MPRDISVDQPADDWRSLPGSDLPKRLDNTIRALFRAWFREMPLSGVIMDWTPVDLTQDPGKHESGWIAPPRWNGQVPFDLWYVWEYGYKVRKACDNLLATLSATSSSAGQDAEILEDLYSIQGYLSYFRLDWYQCAPYVAAMRQMLLSVIDKRGESCRSLWLHSRNITLSPDQARLSQWQQAFAAFHGILDPLAHDLIPQLVAFEQLTTQGSELICRLALLRPQRRSSAALRSVIIILSHLESTMSAATAVASSADDYVISCREMIATAPSRP